MYKILVRDMVKHKMYYLYGFKHSIVDFYIKSRTGVNPSTKQCYKQVLRVKRLSFTLDNVIKCFKHTREEE